MDEKPKSESYLLTQGHTGPELISGQEDSLHLVLCPYDVPLVYVSIFLRDCKLLGRQGPESSVSVSTQQTMMTECHFMSFCSPNWATFHGTRVVTSVAPSRDRL